MLQFANNADMCIVNARVSLIGTQALHVACTKAVHRPWSVMGVLCMLCCIHGIYCAVQWILLSGCRRCWKPGGWNMQLARKWVNQALTSGVSVA